MSVFAAAAEAWRTGRRAAFVTVIEVGGSAPRGVGARMLVRDDGTTVGTIGGGAIEHRVIELARECMRTGRAERLLADLSRDVGMCCGGRMEVYVEPLQAKVPMVVFGAGHVAKATVPLLVSMDFDVTVVDHRSEQLQGIDRPEIRCLDTDPLDHARGLADDPDAHWLIITHDHKLDQELGEVLLPKTFAWLGMIGSRAKIAKFFVRYRAAGMDESLFRKLCAPVGLDLGAETPAEIAVSIAAELVRVRRHSREPALPLSSRPLKARGGDGTALPPYWAPLDEG